MDGAPYRTFGLSDAPGTLGLSCNKQGLALAGVPLLRPVETGFEPRPLPEIARLLSAAYDIDADVAAVMGGLDVVARALNGGDTVRAMIAAAQLKLPALDWDGAVRIAQAEDALRKYSRNQPRDWHGRWTTGDAGGPVVKPQPVSFRPSGQPAESAKPQRDGAVADDQSDFELPKDWVTLPPGHRIDELGDLLEWIANSRPEDAQAIRAEIKRYYYDVGDIQGGNALNRALSEVLQDGPLRKARVLRRVRTLHTRGPRRNRPDVPRSGSARDSELGAGWCRSKRSSSRDRRDHPGRDRGGRNSGS
jgi:hypothetical protein